MAARPKIATRLRLTLSPWDKFIYYNRFPFKLVLAVLVTSLATSRIFLANWQFHDHQNSQFKSLKYSFDLSCPDRDMYTCHLYTIDQVIYLLRSHFVTFQNLTNSSISFYNTTDGSGDSLPIQMKVMLHRSFPSNLENSVSSGDDIDVDSYILTEEHPVGPFESRNRTFLSNLFHRLIGIQVHYRFSSIQIGPVLDSVHSEWNLAGIYDFSVGGGQAIYFLKLHRRLTSMSSDLFSILAIFIIILCFFSAILTVKAFVKAYRIFRFAQHRLDLEDDKLEEISRMTGGITWKALTLRDKCSFFNFWHLVTFIGDFALILGGVGDLYIYNGLFSDSLDRIDMPDITNAIGIICSWVGLIKFFEWKPQFYVLFLAIKNSLTRVARFIITITPLYFGYVFAGVVLFHNNTSKFGTASKASRTLFALLNGDNIWTVFDELDGRPDSVYTLIGHIYTYSFCIFFITTVLNVFIMIIQDGYDFAKTIESYEDQSEQKMIVDNARLNQILIAAHIVGCQEDNSHTCSESEISFANDSELDAVMDEQNQNQQIHSINPASVPLTSRAPLLRSMSNTTGPLTPQYGSTNVEFSNPSLPIACSPRDTNPHRVYSASSRGTLEVDAKKESSTFKSKIPANVSTKTLVASALEQSRERLVTELNDIAGRYMKRTQEEQLQAIRHFQQELLEICNL